LFTYGSFHLLVHTNVVADVKVYGILGLINTTSTFNQSGKIVNLSAPALNIEPVFWGSYYEFLVPSASFRAMRDELFPERKWKVPGGAGPNGSWPSDYGEAMYTLEGTNSVLNSSAMEQRGTCQQTATYRWGFSFLLLFIVLIFFLVWILGTYILWLDAYLHSRLDIVKRDMGLYRAALDISAMIQNDLNMLVDSLTPNDVVERKIKGNKNARLSFRHFGNALPLNTRMMSVHTWAMASGNSRWKSRFTLVVLLVAIIVVPTLQVNYSLSGTAMAVLMSLLVPSTLLNILILGRGQDREPRHESCNSDISHHPLQSFDEDHLPSEPTTYVSETTIDGVTNNESGTGHVRIGQTSKTRTAITAAETE